MGSQTKSPGPPGRVAAFFDFDKTLIRKNTAELYARYAFAKQKATAKEALTGLWWVVENLFNVIDMQEVTRRVLAQLKGQEEEEIVRFCERWFDDVVTRYISPVAVRRMEDHRVQGHYVAILSASTKYVLEPACRHLGIDDFICTSVHVQEGKFLGSYDEPLCYGKGKVVWAQRWSARKGVDLQSSFFYTDSYSDLPMLQAVGFPRVVNPDPQLKAHARKVGWPIESF